MPVALSYRSKRSELLFPVVATYVCSCRCGYAKIVARVNMVDFRENNKPVLQSIVDVFSA